MTVDTLTITRQLVAAGFDRQQAEAVADSLREADQDLDTEDDLVRAVAPLATRVSLVPSGSRPEQSWLPSPDSSPSCRGFQALIEVRATHLL